MIKGVMIKTNLQQDELTDLILGLDNVFCPLGNGQQYKVKDGGFINRIRIVFFEISECSPSIGYPVLIEGGIIYAKKVSAFVASALLKNNIDFTIKSLLELPAQVDNCLNSLVEEALV